MSFTFWDLKHLDHTLFPSAQKFYHCTDPIHDLVHMGCVVFSLVATVVLLCRKESLLYQPSYPNKRKGQIGHKTCYTKLNSNFSHAKNSKDYILQPWRYWEGIIQKEQGTNQEMKRNP